MYYACGQNTAKFPELISLNPEEFRQNAKKFSGPGGRNAFRVRWLEGSPPQVASLSVKPVINSQPRSPVTSISAPLFGKEAFKWKKRLVEMAEKRIVLSGNYCGGEPFNEILDVMERRLAEKPDLKIVILLSPWMVQPSNRERIERLKMQHPDRFQVVTCGEKWMNTSSTLYKKITNHTKALVVDGKHCIMGGSGIQERWSYSNGVGEKMPYSPKNRGLLAKAFIAEEFRDMDFLFSGEKAGKELDKELLKLAHMWEHYNRAKAQERTDIENTPVAQLLSEEPEPCTTTLSSADHLPEMVNTSDFQLYSQGPEMSRSEFMQRVMREIRSAKRHIYIDHQYVHPTNEMIDLIAEKVNQGVPLTVVTNGYESYSPKGHGAFGARNRSVRRQIYKKVN